MKRSVLLMLSALGSCSGGRAVLAWALLSCHGPPSHPVQEPPPSDAGYVAECEAACARLASLDCPEGADGCAPLCVRASRRGLMAPLCIVAAEDKLDLEACRVRCVK